MKLSIDLPWQNYGLVAELAFRMQDKSPQFGKTALQKIIYLLQELHNVKCGYEFGLYTYGPFCVELLSDLDYVQSLQGVNILYLSSGTRGYIISPGDKNEVIRQNAKDFLSEADTAIERIIAEFGEFNAKELELRSTIVYVDRDMKQNLFSRNNFVRLVKEIKSNFSTETIQNALMELESKGYVEVR